MPCLWRGHGSHSNLLDPGIRASCCRGQNAGPRLPAALRPSDRRGRSAWCREACVGHWVLLKQLGLRFLHHLTRRRVDATLLEQKVDDGYPTPQLPSQTHKHEHTHNSISGDATLPSLFSECFRGRRAKKKIQDRACNERSTPGR